MVLDVENLSFAYPEVELFDHLSFSLGEGEALALLGPSGSGKTTLLHLVAGLLQLQGGDVRWEGRSIAHLGEEELARLRLSYLGLVFQHHYLLAELSALENVLVTGYLAGSVDREWGLELLRRVGLEARAHLLPRALSGGERQRVALARALYKRPRLLLADEPTGSLDKRNAERMVALMKTLCRDLGTALLIATHDEHLVTDLPELRLGVQ
ncbi:Lipoprotein-releasing system ATP-binding protein LolD [Calidithermus roseus]|uniref:Lipoprotein-releasing system ATP-binding protein LolD n=1 Tax=Calidithermus roseus TaxID=1644118 RepID=A0A399EPB0_9DEIN|nr:Lipoprotein-releasing system ATP-binding protein LolD [Calidithermus roseus]